MSNTKKLIISLLIPQLAGGIGAIFTASSIPTWYRSLVRPEFAPPNYLFGPVWTTLFIFMGIALFLVWKKGVEKREVKTAITIFGIQLVLNTLWSIIFFALQSPGAAFIEIIFLWIFISWNIIAFMKISRPAGYLLIPYILWVSFAAHLNFSIWMLN